MSYYDNLIDFAESKRLKIFFVSAKLEKGIKDMFNEIKDLCFSGEIKGIEIGKKPKDLSLSIVNPKKPSGGCCG